MYFKFDEDKCEYNNADGFLTIEEVIEYLNNHDLLFDTTYCLNACTECSYEVEGQYPFELMKFYYQSDNKKYFEDFDEAIEAYPDDEVYEMQIYICENCGTWSINYDLA
jgi:hypothetical protein